MIKIKRNKLFSFRGFVLIILGIFLFSGCGNNGNIQKKDGNKRLVAVSIVPQKTFVEAVCGDMVDVVVMVPPGNSPTNYEPIPKEMEQFSKAELYFAIGIPTESANIMTKAQGFDNMKIVKLQDEVAKVYPDREFAPGVRDPHIWLSPKRVQAMVDVIAREMSLLDADNKETYEKNAKLYILELERLGRQLQDNFSDIKIRKFIVFHPTFGYLADDYNLQMYTLEQNGKEATAPQLKEMIDFANEENIKVIFYQAEIYSKQAQSFAEEIGGKMMKLDPLAPDYINNLKSMSEMMIEVMK